MNLPCDRARGLERPAQLIQRIPEGGESGLQPQRPTLWAMLGSVLETIPRAGGLSSRDSTFESNECHSSALEFAP